METINLSDLEPDQHNANKGTERGRYIIESSLEKLGAGRSILLDKNGKIIAGNKTAETAGEIGINEVVIVRTNGDKLVAVMREDLDLDEPTGLARELAYVDNRAGQVSLDFDPDIIADDLEIGLDLSDYWHDFELEEIGLDVGGSNKGNEGAIVDYKEEYMILIECDNESHHSLSLRQLTELGYKCRALIS